MRLFKFRAVLTLGAADPAGQGCHHRAHGDGEQHLLRPGAAAVVTLVVVPRLVSLLRYQPAVTRVTDYRIRILVSHGRVRRRPLRICGLTGDDLASALRQQGCTDLTAASPWSRRQALAER